MAGDIVTRLRQRALYRNNRFAKEIKLSDSEFIENEAADEIERLRALLYCAESDRDHYHKRFDQNQKCLDHIYKKKAWWK